MKYYFLIIVLFVSIVASGQRSFVSVSPYPVNVYQPDGSKLTIYGVGDEFNHFSVTEDGFTVLKNKNGFYEFALLNKTGKLDYSGYRARNVVERNDAEKQFLQSIPKYLLEENISIDPKFSTTEDTPQKVFPSTGTRKVLLLLIKYPDLDSSYPQTEFDDFMNESNYNGTGSFRDYYLQASDGDLTLNVDVFGWYVSKEDYLYYGDDSGEDRARELVAEAVDSAEAAGVDFSIYDNDNDGEVDNLMVVHSGPGAEEGSQTEYIWSHSWNLFNLARTYDGVLIDDYVIQPETRTWGMVGIGVFCHEFGHALGLPDLYDTEPRPEDSEGLGNWCLMAGGAWMNDEKTPVMLSAWTREELGWINPTVISAEGDYSLSPTGSSTDCYKMLTPNSNEYFLLENRYKTGFDSYLPGSGLAIFHVNTSKLDNDDENNKLSDLEEADGLNDLDGTGNRGDAGDVFPGSTNNTSFNDFTNPNSQTYDIKLTGVDIKDIELDESIIRFSLGAGIEFGKDLTFNATSNAINIVSSTVDVDMQVKNEGTESAGAFNVAFYLSTDQTVTAADYLIGTKSVLSLSAGAAIDLNLLKDVLELDPAIPTGNYYVGYIIDFENDVVEIDEENNDFVFTSETMNHVALSNLSFNLSQNNFEINGFNVSVDLLAENLTSATSEPCKIGFFISTNYPVNTGDFFIGEINLESLAPDETAFKSFAANVIDEIPDLPEGNYYVGFIIDYEDVVEELDETDNDFTYLVEQVDNYFISNLTFNALQNNLEINGFDVSIDLQVENTGDLTTEECKVGYFISQIFPVTTNDFYIGETILESISPNSELNKSFSVNVIEEIPDLPEGNYYVGYVIDYNNVIEESDEVDNDFTFDSELLDNYFIANLSFNASENNLEIDEFDVSVDLQVKNSGDLYSGNFKIGFFISQQKTVTTADYFIGELDLESLDPSESKNKNFSKNIASVLSSLPEGNYYIGYIIDYNDIVNEEFENDNGFTFTSPYLSVASNLTFTPSQNNLEISTTEINLSLQVINNGEAKSGSNKVGYYLSEDEVISTSDFLFDFGYVNAINVGDFENESKSIDITSLEGKITRGYYYVGYIIDFQNALEELSETDNHHVFSDEVFKYRPPNITVFDEIICDGESVLFRNEVYNTQGVYEFVFEGQSECDSVIIFNLTVNPVSNTVLDETICLGDSFLVGETSYKTTGIYTHIFTNQFGCDSTVTLNLEVIEPIEITLNESVCFGDSFEVADNNYSEDGTFIHTLSNQFGCDSTIILNLKVNPHSDTLLTKTICQGDSIVVGNSVFKESGVYTEMLTNKFGCDSLVTIDLWVNPVQKTIISDVICEGDSVTIDQFVYRQTGNFVNVFSNQFGCDSIVALDLTVNPVHDTLLEVVLCEGDSIKVGNSVYNETGVFVENLSNKFACDSIVTLVLTVNPVHETLLEKIICYGDSVVVGNSVYKISGSFSDVLSNEFGCDSTVYLNLTVNPVNEVDVYENICEGTFYSIGGTQYENSGTYEHHFSNQFGCDSMVMLYLNVVPLPIVNLGDDFVMFSSETIILDAGIFNSYLWNTGETEQTISINSSNGLGSKTYSLTASDEFLCSGSDEIEITIYEDSDPSVDKEPLLKIFPNPSNGNVNLLIEQVSGKYNIYVFNENGGLVYQNEFTSSGNKFVKSLNLSLLRSGFYTIQLSSTNKNMVERLIISRY